MLIYLLQAFKFHTAKEDMLPAGRLKQPDQASKELPPFNNVRRKIIWSSHDEDPQRQTN